MECSAKKSPAMECFVASSATALTPFSQNSKMWRPSSGLGHAQLWQSKPLFLLTSSHVFRPRAERPSRAG